MAAAAVTRGRRFPRWYPSANPSAGHAAGDRRVAGVISMTEVIRRIPRLVRLGLFAFVLTVVSGGIWTALVIINLHTTRGVPWAAADMTFGALAYLTGSILPGFAVHAAGLVVFFTLIWPGDRSRVPISAGGADLWFWIHLGQILLAVPAIVVFMRLARLTSRYRRAGSCASP